MVPVLHAEREAALRRDRLYQYRIVPPPLTTRSRSISIPDWGQPSHTDDPDHFRLQDLQEFESTDFQASLVRPRMREASRHGKRMQDNSTPVNEPAKRPRLENASILNLIPQVCASHPGRPMRLTGLSHISYKPPRQTFCPWIPAKFRLTTKHCHYLSLRMMRPG